MSEHTHDPEPEFVPPDEAAAGRGDRGIVPYNFSAKFTESHKEMGIFRPFNGKARIKRDI